MIASKQGNHGRTELGSRRASWCTALLLAHAAHGCVDPIGAAQIVDPDASVTTLEGLAWPNGEERWRPLAEPQLLALERLVHMLISAAERGRLDWRQRRELAHLAAFVGVEVHPLHVRVDDRELELWVVSEPADDRRGRGTYLIRIGAAPVDTPELLLQAPHSRFDRHTGAIALRLLLDDEAGAIRAVFLDSAHRHRQLDGSRVRATRADDNPADPAHNPAHPLARVTAAVLDQRDWVLVQLHGFDHAATPDEPELIVASGREQPNRASAETLAQLREALPDHECGHYGIDTERLGARHNVQGRSAAAVGRCFVHLELSEPLRERLRDDADLRSEFADALLRGAERGRAIEEAGGGCR